MLSNFLLLLFLLPPSLHLLDRGEGLYCTDDDIRCGGPYMKNHFPFVRVDPLNGSCSPQITCSDYLLVKIGSLEYVINHIDYEQQTLLMVNHGYFFSNDPVSCPSPTTAYFQDVGPFFSYTQHNLQVSLLHNCSSRVQGLNGVHQLTCSSTSADQYYYTTMDPGFFESECTRSTNAVVNEMSMVRLINSTKEGHEGLMAILQLGFEVTWTPQERIGCNACIQSGGLCRNYSSLDDMVFCNCPDGFTYLRICPGQKDHEIKIPARYITIGNKLEVASFVSFHSLGSPMDAILDCH